jgi:hypothetical protein
MACLIKRQIGNGKLTFPFAGQSHPLHFHPEPLLAGEGSGGTGGTLMPPEFGLKGVTSAN